VPTEHAALGASNAARWINCAGSAKAEEGRTDPGSKFAAEGTAAHALAERALAHGKPADTWLGTEIDGVPVTDEMCGSVQVYVDLVETLRLQLDWVAVEKKFDLAPLKPPAPMFGTADFVGGKGPLLVVADLKFGRGVTVSAEDNHQLRYYALGAWVDLAKRDRAAADAVEVVRVIVCQPRLLDEEGEPLVTSSDIPIADLRAWAKMMLEAARATQAPDAPRTAGEWCKFCRAKADCPTFRGVALAVAQVEFADIAEAPLSPPPVADLTPEQVGAILNAKGILDDWLKAVEAKAFADIEAGMPVPGWALKPKRATRKWRNEEETTEWLEGAGAEAEDYTETKLRSPAQIEKLVGKGKIPEELIVAESSGLTLCRDTDPKAVPLGHTALDALP